MRSLWSIAASTAAGVLVLLNLSGCATTANSPQVRLNEIQVIGSHNSYHGRTHESLARLINHSKPGAFNGLDYNHPPLPEQFSRLGIRQIELDIYADPAGGLFADPLGPKKAAALGFPAVPSNDPEGKLRKPGFKILHMPDVDYWSTVLTLHDGLAQVRVWSLAHRDHVPIFILLELKDEATTAEGVQPLHFTAKELDALEAEILEVFPRDSIVLPDDVRRGQPSMPAALKKYGWPTLDSVRGKVIFALDNEGELRDLYTKGHPALEGKLLFVSAPKDNPAAAWMKMNDAIKTFDKIQDLVREGFLVRTRADTDTKDARANDPTRRDKALASGAQFVSTDFPEPNPAFSTYCVRFGGEVVVRSNPVSGKPGLQGLDLEKLHSPTAEK